MDTKQLLNTFFQTTTLSALTEAVSAALSCPVIVVDNAYRIVSCFAAFGYDDPAYKRAVRHSLLSSEASLAISKRSGEPEDGAFILEKDGKKYRISDLCCGNIKLGYMICILEETKNDDSDYELAGTLLSKQLYFERSRGATVLSTAEEILEELLDGGFSDSEHFRLRAASTFLAEFRPERFAIINTDDSRPSDNAHMQSVNYLKEMFHGSHPFVYCGKIVMFLCSDHDIGMLSSCAEKYKLKIIVSGRIDNLYSMHDMYNSVLRVSDYLTEKNTSEFFVDMSERYTLLMLFRGLSARHDLIDEDIRRIMHYDMTHDSELCLTLYTYIVCHHSLKDTCAQLYTHRNTVLYRIRKIREDFGIDTDLPKFHPFYLFSVSLALVNLGFEEMFIKNAEEDA